MVGEPDAERHRVGPPLVDDHAKRRDEPSTDHDLPHPGAPLVLLGLVERHGRERRLLGDERHDAPAAYHPPFGQGPGARGAGRVALRRRRQLRGSEDGTVEIIAHGGSTLEVRCASGTDLTISTSSGNVDVRGEAGSVKVITKSGDVKIEGATAVNARGASGRVEVGTCSGECHVVFVSSNVHIGQAGRAVVATVSGNIEVGETDDAEVKTVSGKVTLGGRGGGTLAGAFDLRIGRHLRARRLAPETRLKAVSGRVRCDCEPGTTARSEPRA